MRLLISLLVVVFLTACGSLSKVEQEREVPVRDENGNILFDRNGQVITVTEKYKGPKDAWQSAQGQQAQAETAKWVSKRDTAKYNARNSSCPNWHPDQVAALAAEGEAAYFSAVERCQDNQAFFAVRDVAEAGFQEVRAAGGQPGDMTGVSYSVAQSDRTREQEKTKRVSAIMNPLTLGGTISFVAREQGKTNRSYAKNAGSEYGDVTVNASNSGGPSVGAGGGEGASTEALGGEQTRIQNIQIGEGNRAATAGEHAIESQFEKGQAITAPDSSFDGTTQAEGSNTGLELDDSGDGSGNDVGINPF